MNLTWQCKQHRSSEGKINLEHYIELYIIWDMSHNTNHKMGEQ